MTEKLGDRSSWNGQRPMYRVPELLRSDVRSPTTSTMFDASTTSRTLLSLIRAISGAPAYASAKRSVMPET